MKNTKALLSIGVALAITLFASVQITAMVKRENPHLRESDKEELKEAIRYTERYLDPKEKNALTQEEINELRKQLEACKKILYGNRAYSLGEIQAAIYE